MTVSKYITALASILVLSSAATFAQNADSDDDLSIRVNPILEEGLYQRPSQRYSFINYAKNHIIMNGQSWEKLKRSIEGISQGGQVNIVHVGDSHIQAEGSTIPLRQQLQNAFGESGRGLIVPFKIAGTNQPLDYKIQSAEKFTTATLLKTPWAVQPGFTGVGIRPTHQKFDITIQVKTPFNVLRAFAIGKLNVTQVQSGGQNVRFANRIVNGQEAIVLDRNVTTATLTFDSSNAVIAGFETSTTAPGIMYHAIGNNGATFSSYLALSTLGTGIKKLSPNLVIISLGTNEAYGKFSSTAFNTALNRLVADIRYNNPHAEILLTTPSETQQSRYATATKKGARKRSRGRRVKTYNVNPNIATVRNIILKYGAEHHIAVYDWYEVAGGNGSSSKWLNERLLGNDRIHKTWTGYKLEGDLMFNALNEQLKKD